MQSTVDDDDERAIFRQPLEKIQPGIPVQYMYDPEHYQRELDVFWYSMWINVGREEEVPNPRDYIVKSVADQNIVIARDLKGNLRAFHNTCRHRGSILCTEEKGRFEGGSIVCPYHAWTYSLEGDLIATPHQLESADFDMGDYSLYDVAIGTWGGFVFINLAGRDAEPLEMALGSLPIRFPNYHMEDLRIGKRIIIDVKANWKLLFENFAECFHCPTVHPEFCTIVTSALSGDIPRVKLDETGNPDRGLMASESRFKAGAQTLTMDGSAKIPPFRGLNEEERRTLYNVGIVRPNFFMNIHPDYVNIHQMLPTGPESVRMIYDWLFEPRSMERDDFDLDHYVKLWDITNRQDARNCEWQQAGLHSRHFKGSNFVPQEDGPHIFNEWVKACLGESEDAVVEGQESSSTMGMV